MSRKSRPGNRSFGLDNGAGKGDKSRVTDIKRYRENFSEINWRVEICPGCKNEIDLEICHCGDYVKQHGMESGHCPVPMGCTCGYV